MSSSIPLHLATPREVLRTQRHIWKSLHKGLSGTDRMVLNLLVLHADRKGETFVRIATLARESMRGERTVRRSLATLRTRGLLDVNVEHTRRGRSNRYRLRHVEAANDEAHSREQTTLGWLPPREPLAGSAVEDLDVSPASEVITPRAGDFSVPVGGQVGLTHEVTVAAPSTPSPYSDRSQNNVTPCIPLRGTPIEASNSGETRSERATKAERASETRPSTDTVERVLRYFLAQLWPNARTNSVTRKRRRLVAARLAELAPEHAEETLLDAVRGAKLHPWHREANTGFYAEKVFRDADVVEQLAALGRAKRIQDSRRAQEQMPQGPAVRARSRPVVAPKRTGVDADQMQADMAAIFGKAFAAKLAGS